MFFKIHGTHCHLSVLLKCCFAWEFIWSVLNFPTYLYISFKLPLSTPYLTFLQSNNNLLIDYRMSIFIRFVFCLPTLDCALLEGREYHLFCALISHFLYLKYAGNVINNSVKGYQFLECLWCRSLRKYLGMISVPLWRNWISGRKMKKKDLLFIAYDFQLCILYCYILKSQVYLVFRY